MDSITSIRTKIDAHTASRRHELRFDSLFIEGRGLAFPCDADGQVDLDALSERARCNYFLARGLIGRDFAYPQVRPMATGWMH